MTRGASHNLQPLEIARSIARAGHCASSPRCGCALCTALRGYNLDVWQHNSAHVLFALRNHVQVKVRRKACLHVTRAVCVYLIAAPLPTHTLPQRRRARRQTELSPIEWHAVETAAMATLILAAAAAGLLSWRVYTVRRVRYDRLSEVQHTFRHLADKPEAMTYQEAAEIMKLTHYWVRAGGSID